MTRGKKRPAPTGEERAFTFYPFLFRRIAEGLTNEGKRLSEAARVWKGQGEVQAKRQGREQTGSSCAARATRKRVT